MIYFKYERENLINLANVDVMSTLMSTFKI